MLFLSAVSTIKTKDEWTKTFRLAGHLFPDFLAIQQRRKIERDILENIENGRDREDRSHD